MMAFERIEPFGERWEDHRMGTLIALMRNIHRAKDAEPITAQDVFHSLVEPVEEVEQELTEEQRIAYLDAALFGLKT